MSRPKVKAEAPGLRDRPGLRLKIYMADDMIGGGKVELLRFVGEEGSISAAARRMGVDYKRAWFLLDTLQRCFDAPLFETRRGGGGQGAELTDLGRELIARFAANEKAVAEAAAPFMEWLEGGQRKPD